MSLLGQGNRQNYGVQTGQDTIFRGFHSKILYEFLPSLIWLARCSLFNFASPAIIMEPTQTTMFPIIQ